MPPNSVIVIMIVMFVVLVLIGACIVRAHKRQTAHHGTVGGNPKYTCGGGQEGTVFTEADIANILDILSKPENIHSCDEGSARVHVEHCLQQMVRFAHLANKGQPFRAAQWALNLGRAQEIVKAFGGVDAWWRTFKPPIEKGDWGHLETLSRTYIDLFQLEQPSDEFINNA